jgi:hypothetical protein
MDDRFGLDKNAVRFLRIQKKVNSMQGKSKQRGREG